MKNSEIKDEFQARGLAQAKDNLKIDNLSQAERAAYQKYLEDKRYEMSVIESAAVTGEMRGRKEAKIEIAKSLKARGVDINLIVETTELTVDEIEKL